MKNNLECGSIVLNRNMDKLIVVFQKLSNKWGLPKGHMNQKEIHFCYLKQNYSSKIKKIIINYLLYQSHSEFLNICYLMDYIYLF